LCSLQGEYLVFFVVSDAQPSHLMMLWRLTADQGNTRTVSRPSTEADRLLTVMFGVMPSYEQPLMIETRTVMTNCHEDTGLAAKTLRKNIQEVLSDGSLRPLAQQEEYSLFDEAVYVCTHVSTPTAGSAKRAQTFVWAGDAASKSTIEQAQLVARRLGREAGSVSIVTCQQGYETPDFLQALGGIMVTRRGSRKGAPKQYMLCGRKHLGHITFDEMDLSVKSLCPGFVYLVSYPVTLQQTKLYLWKGSACSTEEVSAARLTAMDLSETGEIIEVDDGAEFASFLKVFGPGTTKSSVPKTSPFWRAKGQAPEDFAVRLFRIQQAEAKTSMITSLFTRRPSWNKFSPSRSPSRPAEEVKVEAKHISPFTQSDLDADGIYLLDAHSELYVLVGPLLASQPENVRNALLGQTLLFAAEYAGVCAEERGGREPQGSVLFRGVPEEFALLFRHWSQEEGLWGTASLMAGSRQAHGSTEVKMLPLEEVRKAVCTL